MMELYGEADVGVASAETAAGAVDLQAGSHCHTIDETLSHHDGIT